MSSHLSITALLEYDRWATERLLAGAANLSDKQFVLEFAGELSSVRQQCVHLLSASDRYRARIMGEPVPDVAPESFNSPSEVLDYAMAVAQRMAVMGGTLSPQRLTEEVRNETRRGVFVITVEQTLMQVVNHGTFHRGQIACLLKLHGIEPPDTDLLFWWKAL
jgi:uncharacterized damage-inducible protein DinB